VVWICHALTANSNPEEWWPDLIGPGLCIDTERDFVVCFNTLCSPYGSSSPASVNPATGRPYLLDFPAVTIRDIAAAGLAVRERLGLAAVDLLVGSSLGGFTAFEMALAAPGVFRHQVYIATAPRVSPWLTAMNEAQRMALEADPSFRAARDMALACGGTVLLKGSTTCITDGGESWICDRGCPGMATAGSGDVLSGILAAVCAGEGSLPFLAAAGAWINGRAGEAAEAEMGAVSMTAGDTVRHLPEAIREIRAAGTAEAVSE
jgi:pimeloyl-ACP methyl ester carboxylesterase